MNEIILYNLFKEIIKNSYTLQGRFLMAEGYGNDLNNGNFDDVIKDALGGLQPQQIKYPLAVLMPPFEQIRNFHYKFSSFRIDIFFLEEHQQLNNQFKDWNIKTNAGERQIMEDWVEMRKVATQFKATLDKIIKEQVLSNKFHSIESTESIRRLSKMNNDRLNGVLLSFEMQIFLDCDTSDINPAVYSIDFDNLLFPPAAP